MNELKRTILDMPAAERLQLATFILASLSPEDVFEPSIPEAWILEARLEAERMKKGEVPLKSWEEVKAEIKAEKHGL
ncbi:MAG: hypothetical protein D6722_05445 [Bacteroidetes bacterium]|nr:MAG: hypothetical protein D6722_05445 [Bacteroidota bacterium]